MHGRTSRRRGVIEPSPCREEFIKQIQSPERKRRALLAEGGDCMKILIDCRE